MSVNLIDVKALKAGEYYWLYNDDVAEPLCIGEFHKRRGPQAGAWFWSGGTWLDADEVTPISHIKKPTWKPK